jgi:hypothetical protein
MTGYARSSSSNDRIEELEAALGRCRSVLGNMAMENEGAILNRWPISHEPLRSDARNLLPVIDAALGEDGDGDFVLKEGMSWRLV